MPGDPALWFVLSEVLLASLKHILVDHDNCNDYGGNIMMMIIVMMQDHDKQERWCHLIFPCYIRGLAAGVEEGVTA